MLYFWIIFTTTFIGAFVVLVLKNNNSFRLFPLKSEKCHVCKKRCNISFPIVDGFICDNCLNCAGLSANVALDTYICYTLSDIKERMHSTGISTVVSMREQDEAERAETAAQNTTKPHCPLCGSATLSLVKKGFSLGKATVGGLALGYPGMFAGFIGSKKPMIMCRHCGHRWKYKQQAHVSVADVLPYYVISNE